MDLIKLTKKLVSIKSYVDADNSEIAVADFIYTYLKKLPYLSVEKQPISNGRFNVIARTSGEPQLLLAGHMDTVEPKQGWKQDQFEVVVGDDKMYGLGILDMKSSLAVMLDILSNVSCAKGLIVLFYCDEEYDLQGMKKFISSEKNIGRLAVLGEPTDLKIWNAHRGLIEITLKVSGVTAHAANSKAGINAIGVTMQALGKLKKYITKYSNPTLGPSSLNVAYVRGGLNLGTNIIGETQLGKQGNNVADYAEVTIDIRPSSTDLNAEMVVKELSEIINKKGCSVTFTVRHDFSALITTKDSLSEIEKIIKKVTGKVDYLNPADRGYGDGEMIQKKFKIPTIYIGPSGKGMHAVGEYVSIKSIHALRAIYEKIIALYCNQS